ncbi:MAG TPA: PVC-type heme-binding CxxCH protein [Chthoniobacteraceae bacterium]|nr:PVC-type heme-binding CxxCH protein [Chthoniobacteraceae bacterium]
MNATRRVDDSAGRRAEQAGRLCYPSWGRALLVSLAVALSLVTARAQDVNDPATELASFKLPDGFEANLFASEANGVIKPIQMRWDARGRLWIICSTAYPLIKPGEEAHDQVLILEDTDGDGRADKTTVFDDQLMIPTGLELDPDGHGAWVGEGTKLWHLRDTNGDDKSDTREIVLRGFGTGDNHQNLNSFRWSPGGDLFFCQGLHAMSRVETSNGVVGLDEAGFWRLNTRSRKLEPFFGGKLDPQNPWGWAWTDFSQPFLVAGNNGGIFYPLPEMVPGHDQTRVGNIWVNARSRKSSGPDIVGTAQLPPEWQGIFLTGGYMNNAVWALKITEDGAGYRVTDLPPLVTSSHTSFRAVDVKIGPDGAIYLCDWYNPIIGHYQASFRHPDRDKAHGRIWRIIAKDRPLVKQPKIAGANITELLENLKSPERWTRYESKRALLANEPEVLGPVVETWVAAQKGDDRETERLLVEVLGIFEAIDAPNPALLGRLMKAHEPDARAYAAGAIARWQNLLPDPLALLNTLVADEHPRVRLAAVVALGNIPRLESLYSILYAGRKPMDRFLDSAMHHAVLGLKPLWLPAITSEKVGISPNLMNILVKADGTADTLGELRRLLGHSELDVAEVVTLSLTMAEVGTPDDIAALLDEDSRYWKTRSVGELMAKSWEALAASRRAKPDNAEELLRRQLPTDQEAVKDLHANGKDPLRIAALRLAGAWKLSGLLPGLLKATELEETPDMRRAAIDGLSRLGGQRARARLLALAGEGDLEIRTAAIAGLTALDLPEAARQAVGALFASNADAETVGALLPAFLERKDGSVILAKQLKQQLPPPLPALAEAGLQQLNALGRHDEELFAVLTEIAGAKKDAMRATPEFVAALVKEVRESGNAKHGEEVFRRAEVTCTACHSVAGKGGTIGPSLDSIGSGQPLDFIIGAVIEPQREVKESFEAVEITTKDGRLVQGYKVREANGELVLKDVAQGIETKFPKDQIAARREIGSLMPPGLLERLSREEQRDLFRYLSELGKPK